VLGEWDADEDAKLPERLELATQIILSFGLSDLETTMNLYNGK
jgi:PTH1 family peptidyl-tRNA hydrolase